MSARRLVVTMGERRRSAHQLRNASDSPSVASQILARCRRASLQEGARKQHDLHAVRCISAMHVAAPLEDELPEKQITEKEVRARCSHRSSISTDMDEDDVRSTRETLDEGIAVDLLEEEEDDSEALDLVAPLRSEVKELVEHTKVDAIQRQRKQSASVVSTCTPATPATPVPRRKFGTILREHPGQSLYLFREEAEYSDYLNAMVTGLHTEMDSVVFYEVEVHLSQMKWKVLRRFSEFRKLRQRLLKHLSRRQRFQTTSKCMICANILQSLEEVPFPSRKQQRSPWFPSLRSRSFNRNFAARSAMIIAERKRKLQDFVGACLIAIRGLRQHSRLMCDSSACEISVALRMIEEFLGLSFTRFMRFLNERGVMETDDKPTSAKGKHNSNHHASIDMGSVTARRAALLVDNTSAGRRATIAV